MIPVILIATVCIAPVTVAGFVCEAIGDNKRMQEIAYRNTARRRERWAHL